MQSLILSVSAQSVMTEIQSLGGWGYFAVALMVMMEATLFLSFFSVGTELVILAGALAAGGAFNPILLCIFVSVGAIFGSTLSFIIGTLGDRFFRGKKRDAFTQSDDYKKGEGFFKTHGEISIFLSHFLGPLRPILPATAGFMRMDWRTFMIWNTLGAVTYGILAVGGGYFFGDAFKSLTPQQQKTVLIGLVGLVAIGIVILIIRHFLKHKTTNATPG